MLEQTLNIPFIFRIGSGSGNNLIVGDAVLDLIGTNILIHLFEHKWHVMFLDHFKHHIDCIMGHPVFLASGHQASLWPCSPSSRGCAFWQGPPGARGMGPPWRAHQGLPGHPRQSAVGSSLPLPASLDHPGWPTWAWRPTRTAPPCPPQPACTTQDGQAT